MNMSDAVTYSHEAYLLLFVSRAQNGGRLRQSKDYHQNRHKTEVPGQSQILEPTQIPKAVIDVQSYLAEFLQQFIDQEGRRTTMKSTSMSSLAASYYYPTGIDNRSNFED